MALTAMRDRKDEADAEREQAEKDAAAAGRREALEFANHQAGDPIGQMSLARARYTEYDDRCRDLADQLRRAEAKRARAQDDIRFWGERLEPVTQAAQRARIPDDPAAAAVYFAHKRFVEATQAMRAEARAARPKGRGFAARNESVITCPACLKLGASPEESFLIHHCDADGNPLSGVPDQPVPAPVPDDAERRVRGGYAELSR
jgi:hypothetical protein